MQTHDQLFSGTMADRLLAANFDPGIFQPFLNEAGKPMAVVNGKVIPVANATLRYDEWKHFEPVLLRESRVRLTGIQSIVSRGLVMSMNGMGKTVCEFETLTEFTAAQMTMDGLNASEKDRPNYEISGVPLPITHKDFSLNLRSVNASRSGGETIDTTSMELATRQVLEKLETTFFQGASSYKAGGRILYGLNDFPSINTGSLTAAWNASAATGETILADTLNMINTLKGDSFYGPYIMYVPTNFESALYEDFKTYSDKTVMQRLREIDNLTIVVADKQTASTVTMVNATRDTVQIIDGMAPRVLQWDEYGGLRVNFKVMAIQVPLIRATQSGKCGVVKYT